MEIVERDEDKEAWFAPYLTPLLKLGCGFTFGLAVNALALFFSLFFLLPGKRDFGIIFVILYGIALCSLGLLELVGFVYCLTKSAEVPPIYGTGWIAHPAKQDKSLPTNWYREND